MNRWGQRLVLAALLVPWSTACPPGLDGFRVVAGRDAAVVDGGRDLDGGADASGPVDAGPAPDGSTVDGCDPLLSCTRSCDGLFESVLFQPDFSTFPDSMRLSRGDVEARDGALVFSRHSSDPTSSVSTAAMFSDALLCARIRMPGGGEGVSANSFALGFLTGSGGVELFLEGREERASFYSLEMLPDGVLLGRRDLVWTDAHEMVVLVYLSGETAYAEVLDTVTDVSFAMRGTYRGEMRSAIGWFSAIEPLPSEPVHLLEVRVGIPAPAALAVIER